MTRAEFQLIYDQGPDACFALFEQMQRAIQALSARVEELEERLAQLSKDSHNSSKPPSADPPAKKPKSLRPQTGRASGGQKGHPGTTLCLSDEPDQIIVHAPHRCGGCGQSLESVAAQSLERRQVFDLPPLALSVTEHQALCKRCPTCQHLSCAPFPQAVPQLLQYGPGVRALCVYLQQAHLLPFERTQQILSDLFGCHPSEGSLANFLCLCHQRLAPVEAAIKEAIQEAPVAHFDETGARIGGKLHWLHVCGTQSLTYYAPHAKRGKPALEDIGILPAFCGTAVHDAWASYLSFVTLALTANTLCAMPTCCASSPLSTSRGTKDGPHKPSPCSATSKRRLGLPKRQEPSPLRHNSGASFWPVTTGS
jgi:transposase